jgi:hypothetical protein
MLPGFSTTLVAHISDRNLGISRYARPIDSSLHSWLNQGAPDGGSCGHCNHCTSHSADTLSKLESPMNAVRIEQKSYEMPPREGSASRHFSLSPIWGNDVHEQASVPTASRICPGNTGDWDRTVDLLSVSRNNDAPAFWHKVSVSDVCRTNVYSEVEGTASFPSTLPMQSDQVVEVSV